MSRLGKHEGFSYRGREVGEENAKGPEEAIFYKVFNMYGQSQCKLLSRRKNRNGIAF